jgi:hypothetical protein
MSSAASSMSLNSTMIAPLLDRVDPGRAASAAKVEDFARDSSCD